MKTPAAILVETGKPLVLAELEIPALKKGQVLVEIAYSGVCHTQLLESRGYRGEDKFLPHGLGHEGSGKVLETGPEATKVKVDDDVILSWMKGTGLEAGGTVYRWGERPVNAGGITTFSRLSVLSENRLTALPKGIPMRLAAMMGCAIPTGFGSVFNTAQVRSGNSVAVFGAGGIGLCAVAAARLAGCETIVAVDMRQDRLVLAKSLGASHIFNAKDGDPVAEVLKICPGGADFAFDATGRPAAMKQALLSVRNQGGAAVIIGNAREGEKLEIDPKQFNLGKRILGTWGGDNQPDRDFPSYCKFISTQKVDLKPLIAQSYSLRDINAALDDLESGKAVRPLIDLSA